MPDDSAHEPDDASIFSRGSLKLTFELIRKTNPSLALAIRNLTAKEPVCNTSEQGGTRHLRSSGSGRNANGTCPGRRPPKQ